MEMIEITGWYIYKIKEVTKPIGLWINLIMEEKKCLAYLLTQLFPHNLFKYIYFLFQ